MSEWYSRPPPAAGSNQPIWFTPAAQILPFGPMSRPRTAYVGSIFSGRQRSPSNDTTVSHPK